MTLYDSAVIFTAIIVVIIFSFVVKKDVDQSKEELKRHFNAMEKLRKQE
ncbi:MAG: hypothetical protein ACXVMS_12500 [Flavisolibacter sp.]